MSLEPIEIEVVQTCRYKAKVCKGCGKPKSNAVHRHKNVAEGKPYCAFQRSIGCASCGKPKKDVGHFGSPPSFNVMAGADPNIYRSLKEAWHEVLLDALDHSDLPRGLGRVVVEGEATFPDAADRDQGNYRVVIEKALGDALQAGGWLDNDDWSHYEFGGLAYRHEPGVSRTRLLIFPTMQAVHDEGTLFAGIAA